MMKKVCIVGFGAIAKTHASALEKVGHATFSAVCDIDPAKIEKCLESHSVKTYTDFDEMLLDKEIDSVHICTPHHLHFEMIKKALAAGKKVVCEKPVTRTKEEYNELLRLENSDQVCVILQNRLNPCIVRMKELIDGGSLGKIVMARGILTWHRTMEYYNQGEWRGKWATEGGGVLINQAVHTLDYFNYLVGEVTSVQAKMSNFSLSEIEVEDSVMAHLVMEEEIPGVFFATNAYGKNASPFFEVEMEEGTLRYIDKKLFLNGEVIEEDKKSASVVSGKDYWGNSHEKVFKRFYEEGKFFSPHDVKNTMETMFAMYESARE